MVGDSKYASTIITLLKIHIPTHNWRWKGGVKGDWVGVGPTKWKMRVIFLRQQEPGAPSSHTLIQQLQQHTTSTHKDSYKLLPLQCLMQQDFCTMHLMEAYTFGLSKSHDPY